MNRHSLAAATWATIAGAIVSALWLASVDPAWPEWPALPALRGSADGSGQLARA